MTKVESLTHPQQTWAIGERRGSLAVLCVAMSRVSLFIGYGQATYT